MYAPTGHYTRLAEWLSETPTEWRLERRGAMQEGRKRTDHYYARFECDADAMSFYLTWHGSDGTVMKPYEPLQHSLHRVGNVSVERNKV